MVAADEEAVARLFRYEQRQAETESVKHRRRHDIPTRKGREDVSGGHEGALLFADGRRQDDYILLQVGGDQWLHRGTPPWPNDYEDVAAFGFLMPCPGEAVDQYIKAFGPDVETAEV